MDAHHNELGTLTIGDDQIAVLSMAMDGRANKIGAAFGRGFGEFLGILAATTGLKGLVITSAHKDFCVGADLDMLFAVTDPKEILGVTQGLHGALRKLEQSPYPVVAALTGSALGGGYELALACHRRIGLDDPSVQFGLPEVSLGVIPGGGGTQRLPRLIGVQASLELMAAGTTVRAPKAKSQGLVDELQPSREAVVEAARAWCLANPRAKQPWDKADFRWPGMAPDSDDGRNLLNVAAAMLYKRTAGAYRAPEVLLSVVQDGARLTFDAACTVEQRAFAKLATSPQAKDMIRTLWFHRTAAEKQKDLPAVASDGFRKVAILGAGMMGSGLAFVCAQRGYDVVMKDIRAEALEKGLAHIQGELAKLKHLGEAEKAAILGRIKATTDDSDLDGSDLIIEAVLEDLEVKHKVIAQTEPRLSPGGIYASNTSALPITRLAEASKRKGAFIGLHFFSPVEKMPLIEIILGKETDEATLARSLAFARNIKKTAIVVNDGYGFFTSRVFSSYILEGAELVAEGHDPVLVEWAARTAGMVVPPLQVFDEVTLALGVHAMKSGAKVTGRRLDLAAIELVRRMVEVEGRLGKAHGAGFYDYEGGKRRGIWKGLKGLVGDKQPAETGVALLARRLLLAQCAETARALDEGILRSYRDAEVGAILGIGFAPNTGGPLAYMDRVGLPALVAELDGLAAKYGERYAPAPVLRKMAAEGKRFFEA